MRQFVTNSTGSLGYTPAVSLTALALATTDPAGASVALGTPAGSGLSWAVTVQSTVLPDALAYKRLKLKWTLTTADQTRDDIEYVWVLPYAVEAYGDLDAVQELMTMVVFSATSNPTIDQVCGAMQTQYRFLNARLDGAGYTVPIEDATGMALLADAENLLTAASLLERLIISKNTSADKVGVAEVWRGQAEKLIKPMLTGGIKVGQANSAGSAGITNGSSATTDTAREDFIASYGGQS